MRLFRRLTLGVLGTAAVLGAVFAVSVLLGQDSVRAGAADTEILPAHSNSSPTYTPSVVLVKGGDATGPSPCSVGESDPTTDCLYFWAKNVNNTTGASAFEVKVTYDASVIHVDTIAHFTTWLGSTQRSVACVVPTVVEDPDTGVGEARITCNTLLPPPPYGPACNNGHCSGQLGLMAFESRGTAMGSTTLNLSQSMLVDTPPNPDNAAAIPATVRSVNVVIAKCADFTGSTGSPDGTIRVNDILYVVNQYFTPGGDLDGDGTTRVNDILIGVQQYFADCWQ